MPDSTNAVTGLPADQFAVELAARSVTLTLAESIYPLEAIYGASYTFIDRCYVLLDRLSPTQIRVVVTPKKDVTSESELRAIAGELVNELLSCAWRAQIVRENRAVIEAVTMQAVGGAMGPPSLDELKDFDFSEEPFEDPLGIGMSWEDKYKKNGPTASGTPADKKNGPTASGTPADKKKKDEGAAAAAATPSEPEGSQ